MPEVVIPIVMLVRCVSGMAQLTMCWLSGEWGSGDDRRLLKALLASGATQEHEVSWGNMVPNRTAQQAQRRWRLMVKRVPDRYDKEFDEHLNFLVDTFAPNLRDATSALEQPNLENATSTPERAA